MKLRRTIFILLMIFINCFFINSVFAATSLLEMKVVNTQYMSGCSGKESNESIILKTSDNKIIMIDTAEDYQCQYNEIKNQLKALSGSNTPTINYLIISHSHSDHAGNLTRLLSDSSITIDKVFYKSETYGEIPVSSIISNYSNKYNSAINTTTLSGTNYQVAINSNVTMYLLNLSDVYSTKSENVCNDTQYSVKFFSQNKSNSIKKDNKYIYLNSLAYGNSTLSFKSTIEDSDLNSGLSNGVPTRKYFATTSTREGICSANANSIAVLFKVNVGSSYKYIYIPSDLENNGYSFFGEYNATAASQPENFKYSTIYGSGTYHFFENTFSGSNYNNSWTISNNKFVEPSNNNTPHKVAQESKISKRVLDIIGESNINNLVIYLESHHGFNNAKDAIDTLSLNRSNVYSIKTWKFTGKNSSDALQARSYHYALPNANKLSSGGDNVDSDGVKCRIQSGGTYKCKVTSKSRGSLPIKDDYYVIYNVNDTVSKVKANSSTAIVKEGTTTKSDTAILKTGDKVYVGVSGKTEESFDIAVLGDLNGNGKATIADVAKMYRAIQGSGSLSELESLSADMDKNGTVNNTDLTTIYGKVKGGN